MGNSLLSRARALLRGISFWIGVIVPVIYLIVDPTYYNKDDNFSQFTPVFHYAYTAMLDGQFPWVSPADYTVRLAQAPYYAIFSPILILAWIITYVLQLPIYWIINLWALMHLALINLVLIRFVRTLSLPTALQAAVVLSAGTATYMAQYSVNWYYTLPFQLLLISKIAYWHRFMQQGGPDRGGALIVLGATWLAVYGGNPQLLLYTLIVEALLLLPLFNWKVVKSWLLMMAYTGGILVPFIYNHLLYWSTSSRVVVNTNVLHVEDLIRRSLWTTNPETGGGWVLVCAALILVAFFSSNLRKRWPITGLVLAVVSVFLLGLSAGVVPFSDEVLSIVSLSTLEKWWFFGGISSVLAVAILAQTWSFRLQQVLIIWAWLASFGFLKHTFSDSSFAWNNADYSGARFSVSEINRVIESPSHRLTESRVYQVPERVEKPIRPIDTRIDDLSPSSSLLLNTWLGVDDLRLMSWGYESMQPAEARQYGVASANQPDSLRDAGVSHIWVNASRNKPSDFQSTDYILVYESAQSFLLELTHPGRIVTCSSACRAEVELRADGLSLLLDNIPAGQLVTVKINPLRNFTVRGQGEVVSWNATTNGWLSFTTNGAAVYEIRYEDRPFLWLLLFSQLVFAVVLVRTVLRYRMHSSSLAGEHKNSRAVLRAATRGRAR